MRCGNCHISVFEKPLSRVNPFGESGQFWCDECIKKHEPELYRNIKEDETKVLADIKKIIYSSSQ